MSNFLYRFIIVCKIIVTQYWRPHTMQEEDFTIATHVNCDILPTTQNQTIFTFVSIKCTHIFQCFTFSVLIITSYVYVCSAMQNEIWKFFNGSSSARHHALLIHTSISQWFVSAYCIQHIITQHYDIQCHMWIVSKMDSSTFCHTQACEN